MVCDCGCNAKTFYTFRFKLPEETIKFTTCGDCDCFYRMAELKLHPKYMSCEETTVPSSEDCEMEEADRRVKDFF